MAKYKQDSLVSVATSDSSATQKRGPISSFIARRSQASGVSTAASPLSIATSLESLHNCLSPDVNMWPIFSPVGDEFQTSDCGVKQAIFMPQKRRELNGHYEGLYDLAARTVRWIRRLKDAGLLDKDNSYAYSVQVPQNLEASHALLTETEFKRAKDSVCSYQQIMRVNYIPRKPEVVEVTLRFKNRQSLTKSLGIHTTDDHVIPYPLITQIQNLEVENLHQLLPGRFIVQIGSQDTAQIRMTQYTMAELFARECLGSHFIEILNGNYPDDDNKQELELKLLVSKVSLNLAFPDSSDELDYSLRCVDFYPQRLPSSRQELVYESPVNVFQRAVAWIQQQLNVGVRCLIPELMPIQTLFAVVENNGNIKVLEDIFLQGTQREAVRRLVVKDIEGVSEIARMYTVVQAVRVWYRSVPNDIELEDIVIKVEHPKGMPVSIDDLEVKLHRYFSLPHPHVQRKNMDKCTKMVQASLEKLPLGVMVVAIDGDPQILHPPRSENMRLYLNHLNGTIILNAEKNGFKKGDSVTEHQKPLKLKSIFTSKKPKSKLSLDETNQKQNQSSQDIYTDELVTSAVKFTISKAKIDALEVPDSNVISWADCSGDLGGVSYLGDHDEEPLPLGDIAHRAIAYTALKLRQMKQNNGNNNILNFKLRPMWQIVCFPENRTDVRGAFQARVIKLPDDHEHEDQQGTMPVPMISSIYKTSFNRTKFKQAVRVIFPVFN